MTYDAPDPPVRAKQADRNDPLTRWNVPGFTESRRRLLDLLELVPSLKEYQSENPSWRHVVAALGDAHNKASDMNSDQLRELTENPPEDASLHVEQLAEVVIPLLEARIHGRHRRQLFNEEAVPAKWKSRDFIEDYRIVPVAESMISILSSPPFPQLHRQVGHRNRAGIASEPFGRLWLADVTSSTWTVLRSYHSDKTRRRDSLR